MELYLLFISIEKLRNYWMFIFFIIFNFKEIFLIKKIYLIIDNGIESYVSQKVY